MQKTVLITGATKNTGYAIAERFAEEGWNVVVTSRDQASAEAAAEQLSRKYPDSAFLGVAMDVANVSEIRSGFASVAERFGTLDAYISNAANLGVGLSVLNTTEEDWDAVMNANARGSFFGAQEAVRLMKNGGALLFISSVHANKSIPGRICYTASKAAIGGMMRGMAVELGCMGIRANCLLAGAIRTDRWDGLPDEEVAARRARWPAGRESYPKEIADAAYFLCTAETVTGIEMPVDSGISSCLLAYNKDWMKNDPNNVKYWEKK